MIQLSIAWLVLTAVSVSAQVPAAVTVQGASRVKTFSQTLDGDWETTIRTADGSERPFRYIPPNKIQPQVHVDLRMTRGDRGPQIQYRYHIANGAAARQELAGLFFRGVLPADVVDAPAGWNPLKPPAPGNLTLLGPFKGQQRSGLPPNTGAHWVIESAGLPGVVTMQGIGATADGLAVRVPAGLTEEQRADLDALSTDVLMGVPAIGPMIGAGIGEPELTFSIVLARVLSHYVSQMRLFSHPAAADVERVAKAIDGGRDHTLDAPGVRPALAELSRLARRPADAPWHAELSAALAACIDMLLTGELPLKSMPGAAH